MIRLRADPTTANKASKDPIPSPRYSLTTIVFFGVEATVGSPDWKVAAHPAGLEANKEMIGVRIDGVLTSLADAFYPSVFDQSTACGFSRSPRTDFRSDAVAGCTWRGSVRLTRERIRSSPHPPPPPDGTGRRRGSPAPCLGLDGLGSCENSCHIVKFAARQCPRPLFAIANRPPKAAESQAGRSLQLENLVFSVFVHSIDVFHELKSRNANFEESEDFQAGQAKRCGFRCNQSDLLIEQLLDA